jgi:hypothetical protein
VPAGAQRGRAEAGAHVAAAPTVPAQGADSAALLASMRSQFDAL